MLVDGLSQDRACEHAYSQLFHFLPDRASQVLAPGRAGTTDVGRANVVLIQADPVPAQIIKGREDPPQGWHSPGHGQLEPAPAISFDQTARDTATYDTVVFPLDVGQAAEVAVGRLAVEGDDGTTVLPLDICALRIVTNQGTDYYLNDLRQKEVGPPNGCTKITDPLETDARAAVVRLGRDGNVVKASAIGASFLRLNGRAVWRPQDR